MVELGDQTIGIVVDGVSEVLEIEAGAIEPPSPFVVPSGSGAVWGIAKVSDRLIILLDLDAVLSGEEKERLKAMADCGKLPGKRRRRRRPVKFWRWMYGTRPGRG